MNIVQTVNYLSSFKVPNMAGPRVKVSTCLNLHKWEEYLCTYSDNLVIDSLKYGWPLNFQGDFIPESTFINHPSAVRLPTVL